MTNSNIMGEEAYTWCAVYEIPDDEFVCVQETAENSFADVDLSRTRVLLLLTPDGRLAHRVDIPSGAMPLFFRRRQIVINPDEQEKAPTIHCIGWKRGNEATYHFVFEDGSTLLTDDLQAI